MSKLEKSKYVCVNAECPEKDAVVLRLQREGKKWPCEGCDLELAEDIQAVTPTGTSSEELLHYKCVNATCLYCHIALPATQSTLRDGCLLCKASCVVVPPPTSPSKGSVPPLKMVSFAQAKGRKDKDGVHYDSKASVCAGLAETKEADCGVIKLEEGDQPKEISTQDFVKSLTNLEERPGPSAPRKIVDQVVIKEPDELTLFEEKLEGDRIMQFAEEHPEMDLTVGGKKNIETKTDDEVFIGEYEVSPDDVKFCKLREHIEVATGRIAQYHEIVNIGNGAQGVVDMVKFYETEADKAETLNGVDDELHRPKDGEIYARKELRNKAGQKVSRKGKGKDTSKADRKRYLEELYEDGKRSEKRWRDFAIKEFEKFKKSQLMPDEVQSEDSQSHVTVPRDAEKINTSNDTATANRDSHESTAMPYNASTVVDNFTAPAVIDNSKTESPGYHDNGIGAEINSNHVNFINHVNVRKDTGYSKVQKSIANWSKEIAIIPKTEILPQTTYNLRSRHSKRSYSEKSQPKAGLKYAKTSKATDSKHSNKLSSRQCRYNLRSSKN